MPELAEPGSRRSSEFSGEAPAARWGAREKIISDFDAHECKEPEPSETRSASD